MTKIMLIIPKMVLTTYLQCNIEHIQRQLVNGSGATKHTTFYKAASRGGHV